MEIKKIEILYKEDFLVDWNQVFAIVDVDENLVFIYVDVDMVNQEHYRVRKIYSLLVITEKEKEEIVKAVVDEFCNKYI